MEKKKKSQNAIEVLLILEAKIKQPVYNPSKTIEIHQDNSFVHSKDMKIGAIVTYLQLYSYFDTYSGLLSLRSSKGMEW